MTDHGIVHFHRVGVFATLTNSYALTAIGASENFYRYVYKFTHGSQGTGRKRRGTEVHPKVGMRQRDLHRGKRAATRQRRITHGHRHGYGYVQD